MYAAPPILETQVYAKVPPELEVRDRSSDWLQGRQHGKPTSFLEGPSFDLAGNLYVTDIPYGRVLRITPQGGFSLVTEYDGEPNGLKIHKDGRIFIADQKNGLLVLGPGDSQPRPFLTRAHLERLKGPNDLIFASNGDLYFTDQAQTGLQDPTGRLYCLRADGRLDMLLDNVPSPNGLVLSPDESVLFLAVTRANAIWRVPLSASGRVSKVGNFIQLSGGGGPDGLAIDEDGNLAIAHAGLGSVWLFSAFGEPLYRIVSCTGGRAVTNLAYGGPDRKTLFITESSTGTVIKAQMDVPGRAMYSHM
ncbi:SMP-30/gluconolactonase/LRE family protein [Verticiella sediminum]|uniref:SMP-30/gluconolactonase/LRE family protein n=1 Tax=Verticiella sediminum TaxID=1247510 RepID=A0A556AYC7_9BURK|nr:SMP-30/gluconolactonase/LRE family protein [Verticiella sediminum]TSH97896.1 SMP-30/gluconolactonase/LRE family protein [Verticiella sediminum]